MPCSLGSRRARRSERHDHRLRRAVVDAHRNAKVASGWMRSTPVLLRCGGGRAGGAGSLFG